MEKGIDIQDQLRLIHLKNTKGEDQVIDEVKRILNNDLHTTRNVLNNLKTYNQLNELLEEEYLDGKDVYSINDIREIAIRYRLCFVDSQAYKFEFPYESVLKIEHLNERYKKNLKSFKLLATHEFLKSENSKDSAVLFVPTDHGNYYLIHQWGKLLPKSRIIKSWPFRSIENMLISVALFTLVVTLCLPTFLITLDRTATYWCGYRLGVFFHLLIFFMGITTYVTFAFGKSLSSMNWDKTSKF